MSWTSAPADGRALVKVIDFGLSKTRGANSRPAAMPRCCLPLVGSSASSTCKPTCNFQSEVLLCDPNAPSTCGGASCRHFTGMTLPPTWGYCN